MSRAAISVFGWGIYMLFVGAIFLVAPNTFMPLMGFAPSNEVWIRVLAILAAVLGYFYVQAARHELMLLFRWKVQGHIFGIVCMVALVLLELAPPALLMFAATDLIGAVWTALAIHSMPELTPTKATR